MHPVLFSFKFIVSYVLIGIIGIISLVCVALHYCIIKKKTIKHPAVTYTCVKNNYSLMKYDNCIYKSGNYF